MKLNIVRNFPSALTPIFLVFLVWLTFFSQNLGVSYFSPIATIFIFQAILLEDRISGGPREKYWDGGRGGGIGCGPTGADLSHSYPANGSQKLIEIEDDRRLRVFMDKRMGQEVPGDSVGDEFAGYIFKITGGNDKQGFPMKQGVMHPTRVKLLLSKGHSCYRPRRTGERKRKSVRGCIVAADLAVLSLVVVKQGDGEVAGLTDVTHPKRLGPKRATKIRKFFGLNKDDDVCSLRLKVVGKCGVKSGGLLHMI